MDIQRAEVVICGAGIAGIAVAYNLAVHHGVRDVLLVDERAPLTLTSDKSTEAYRNWWPGPDDAMVAVMNRSIDILEGLAEESDNIFLLNRRGYLYATGDAEHARELERLAERAAALGAGPVRYHSSAAGAAYTPAPVAGYRGQPAGSDVFRDPDLIRRQFPYLSDRTVGVVHARRCGWFSGQQLGMYLLQRAQAHGVRFLNARVTNVDVAAGRVARVHVHDGESTTSLSTSHFVNAAGPMVKDVGALLDVGIPVFAELHLKVSFNDARGAIPRDAPMLIWDDPQQLAWSADERAFLAESDATRHLLEELPAGVHCRPDGGLDSPNILILWPYHTEPMAPVFPLPDDPYFPEIALRGMATMIPALSAYLDRIPQPYVDGGYYIKTRENRMLCGPLPVEGAYVLGALSGYGLMVACGAGELLAAHITDSRLPAYASAFLLERYDDPGYRQMLEAWGPSMQI